MKRAALSLMAIWMMLGFASSALAAIGLLPNGDRYAADKVIVALGYESPKLMTGNTVSGIAITGNESIDRLCRRIGVLSVEPFYPWRLTKPSLIREVSRLYIFTLADGIDAADVIQYFRDDPMIETADLTVFPELCYNPNDPRFTEQWYLRHTSAHLGWDIVRGDTTRHSVIGIIDTGIHWEHPDIAPNIWINPAEDANHNGQFDSVDNDGIDADSNGFVDDVVGWDFGSDDNRPVDDVVPHGTPVAGAASEATDNGLWGAAIGFSARLMGVKVFGSDGMPNNAYQGMVYAAENGAQVINCSWSYGSYGEYEQGLITAAWNAGALIVAPAAAQSNDVENYPAAYEHVLAVAATDQTDHKTSFSSYGVWIDISAPGLNIQTTYGDDGFMEYSGTSFSSAMVSGLAALIRAWYPALTPNQTEALIKSSADPIDSINPGYAGRLGAGRINCGNWFMTPIEKEPELPGFASLIQSYPNPFNAETVIRYILAGQSNVRLDIYNVLGEKIATLADEGQAGGPHEVTWDASDVPSGVYFYRLSANGYRDIKRCLLLK